MSKIHKVNLIWMKGEYILKEYWNELYGTLTHHIWNKDKECIIVATGGWSKNEEIIQRLSQTMFWHLYWQQSRRGGLYVFAIGCEQNEIEELLRND